MSTVYSYLGQPPPTANNKKRPGVEADLVVGALKKGLRKIKKGVITYVG